MSEAVLQLPGVKVLLEGPTGTGKTYALASLVEWCAKNEIEVFALFLEQGLETLIGYWADKGQPVPDNLHWHNRYTKPVSLAALQEAAKNVGKLTYDSITKLHDATRAQNNAFEQIISVCADFPDDRTGKKFGAVDSWGPNKVFICDGLSELSNAAMKMVIGSKPTASPGEYGVAQNNLMNFLRLCTTGCKCHFVLLAHVSREKDEITGGIKLMTRAVGAAISGDIPPLFSEVIYTVREGSSWFWDTANANVDLKSRYLPIQSKITPSFAQILDKWRARSAGAKPVPVTPA
jgi:hypothetical protein